MLKSTYFSILWSQQNTSRKGLKLKKYAEKNYYRVAFVADAGW